MQQAQIQNITQAPPSHCIKECSRLTVYSKQDTIAGWSITLSITASQVGPHQGEQGRAESKLLREHFLELLLRNLVTKDRTAYNTKRHSFGVCKPQELLPALSFPAPGSKLQEQHVQEGCLYIYTRLLPIYTRLLPADSCIHTRLIQEKHFAVKTI